MTPASRIANHKSDEILHCPSRRNQIGSSLPASAKPRPAIPPSPASVRVSVSSCLTMREPAAPIDSRTAISRLRVRPRASSNPRQVCAGNQQQRPRYRHQQAKLRGIVGLILRRGPIGRKNRDLSLAGALQPVARRPGHRALRFRLGLRHRRPRSQGADHLIDQRTVVGTVIARVAGRAVHHRRDPHIDGQPRHVPVEISGRNAHNLEQDRID